MARWVTPLWFAALWTATADAQYLTFNAPGSASVTFDSLPTSGATNAWANGITVNGVYAFQSLVAPGVAVTNVRAGDGGSNTGALYSFGAGTDAERTLGTVASGTPGNFAYGVVVQNSTANPLTVTLGYDGEQWRNGAPTTPAPHTLQFSYRASAAAPTGVADWDPASATPAGYTDLDALDFTGPVAGGTAGGLNGNDAANRVAFAPTSVATVNPGEFLVLRWFDPNDPSNDHGLAIDNLVVTAVPVPEPAGLLAAGLAAVGLSRAARRRQRGGSPRNDRHQRPSCRTR
jgi:hypothetical protein